ncbi:MAG: tetratricopeptide repeat protein [Proteobacteria bacterium]|nr:tetratricopeptide repeat protein [Pseudomonadota bacterium]
MGDFYSELKRRNVVRVGIAYAVAGGLMIELADTIAGRLGMPDWVPTFIIIAVLIGLPIVLFFSWSYELTPQGLKKTHEVDADDSISHSTGRRLDFAIIGMLVLALGYFVWDRFGAGPVLETGEDFVEAESDDLRSIAVLPFVNMSPNPEQEYFSDGISEELLHLLAKIPELRVISRSSSFSYKGKDIDIPTIAEQLNVAYILEGSVRMSGNQLRITAQLIEASSDTHLWSETYERTLDDIFAMQDEIAAKVVEQLKVTLLDEVPTIRATDPGAYALYLQGRHLHRKRTAVAFDRAQLRLEQALTVDPGYAAAWDELGSVYVSQLQVGRRPVDEGFTLAREATEKALALDPEYALAHANLGRIAMLFDNDLAAAVQYFERALQLETVNPDIVRRAAKLLASIGRLKEAIALAEFGVANDPVDAAIHSNLAWFYSSADRWDEAITTYNTTLKLSPGYGIAQYAIGVALLFKGEPQAALEAMQQVASHWRLMGLSMVYHALGRATESDAALADLIAQHERNAAYNIAYIFAYRGESDRAFEWLDKAVEYKDPGLSYILYEPLFANIHDDPRWLPFLKSIGKSPEQLATIEFNVTLPE